ncbi:DUF3219 family protein [Bacillus sp. UMB0893]|uniref:DUF3219 family protein n=1 Tax=Bacillus sp. UMB0893 TaxID=2066053 RepID=UPI000C78C34B|nr:DUF3219 family protein [Bacillus sp. UMB0893]PLR66822.1 DUF3219 domain-containing protein [Bacillus sp. UMB0893]
MTDTVLLNHTEIKPYSFKHEVVVKEGRALHKITLDFKVKSSEYHEITTLLYNQNFKVNVPGVNLAFQGTISNYITSLINLYEEGAVGDFHLELIEV